MDSNQPRAVAEAYLTEVDRVLPGLVERLYLVGSAALGAWRPGVSDVDAIIFTSRPLADADLALLPTTVEGPYLAPDLHDVWPADGRVAPFVVAGALRTAMPCGELNPAVWLTLQRYGITVRGPRPDVRVEAAELRDYCLTNLRDYWQANVAEVPSHLAMVGPDDPAPAEAVSWFLLGPARLHYTLAYADIVSKAGAGDYLASLFPAYADLVRRVLRGDTSYTMADLALTVASVNEVADDAWRRFAP